jgi:hypothetical protein
MWGVPRGALTQEIERGKGENSMDSKRGYNLTFFDTPWTNAPLVSDADDDDSGGNGA